MSERNTWWIHPRNQEVWDTNPHNDDYIKVGCIDSLKTENEWLRSQLGIATNCLINLKHTYDLDMVKDVLSMIATEFKPIVIEQATLDTAPYMGHSVTRLIWPR